MKNTTKLCLLFIQLLVFTAANAQSNFWTDVSESSLQSSSQKRLNVPDKGRALALDHAGLQQFLRSVPLEFTLTAARNQHILSIPMPDGGFENFAIVESPMMEPALAAKVPDIKTYSGQGIEDPTATIKIDVTPAGFHGMILSSVGGAVFIDPYFRNASSNYISYYKKDYKTDKRLIEATGYSEPQKGNEASRGLAGPCIAGTLRTYRLAVACTGEYAVAVGATTKEQALSAITTTMNRVNGIYERELDIRMILVANELKIIFTNAATDKFLGNSDATTLIDESQQVITDSIGSANYDIGHTFSTGAGGLAGLGVVCRSTQKARGVTGSTRPTGDAYDVDYVAHEMGHQFGATHTFNATTDNCSGNGEKVSNVEPGSGSTIMAYAGICSTNNLQVNSDPQFHAISLQQINAYVSGTGGTCAVNLATGNGAPTVNAGADYTIPRSTPFIVTGSATDPNGDALTYSWEEIDLGGPFGNATTPTGQAPLFRSFPPTATNFRIFPRLANIIGNSPSFGEVLPSYGRTINLRLTARDNKAGGGGVCSDDMRITVAATAGPFNVSSPNTAVSWQAGSFRTVTWNVNGTDVAPVNCSQVNISLSTDGGLTFPILLSANTPNDGSEEVKVPTNLTSQARIRVMASNNIFFDMSNANFSIVAATTTEFIFNNPALVTKCDGVNLSTMLRTSGLGGFNTPITLTTSEAPAGTTIVLSSTQVTPGSDVTVTLQGTLAPGKYTITITGEAGNVKKSQNIEFVVGTLTSTTTLNLPANNAIGQTTNPTFTWSAVNGATSYTLEISETPSFNSLLQSVTGITTTSLTLTTLLTSNTQYYWRVRANNICGAGAASPAFLFRTAALVCADPIASTNVPKSIPAAGATTITSNLVVNTSDVISDVNVVGLKGTHDYVSDITVSLTSPSGTSAVLFDQICDDALGFDMNLDDEATLTDIPCPPVNGITVKPTEPLSVFKGQSTAGTWVLSVKDNYDTDGGLLTGWGLRFCSNVATPLPVNWLSFTAQKAADRSVSLQWSTANEVSNHHYIIERSSDGINFSSIGKMDGGKNLNMLQHYVFSDMKPFAGANYYRLKQVDADGQFSYSSIVKVVVEGSGVFWSVYPNPAHGQSTIKMHGNATKLKLVLTDASGKTVYSSNRGAVKTGEQIVLPLHGLAQGLYILKIDTGESIRSEKIVVR